MTLTRRSKIYENPEMAYIDASRSVAQMSNFTTSVVVQNATDYSVFVSTDRIRALIGVRVTDLNVTEHRARLSYAVLSYSLLSEKQAANFSWTKNNTVPDAPSTANGTLSAWPALNVVQTLVLEAPYRCRGFEYDLSGLYLSNYTAALDTPDLLYDGSCYRPLFTSVIEYDDFGFIRYDMGDTLPVLTSAQQHRQCATAQSVRASRAVQHGAAQVRAGSRHQQHLHCV